jgi:hypothetical protein
MRVVGLTSGELEIALLWGAVLAAHGIKAKVEKAESAFQVAASGGDAARLAGLYFLYGPPLLEGDEKVINHKLSEAVQLGAGGLNVSWEGLRRTKGGLVAADLTLLEGGAAVKYNVYLRRDDILLKFHSSSRSRAELAARLLKLAGVGAEVRKVEVDGRDIWYVWTTTDRLAAGREELRKAIAEIVETALARGWVDAGKAEGWLEKLKRGRTLMEGWPKYHVGLKEGALVVRFASTDPYSIKQEAQRLKEIGLKEGVHFSVKIPEGGGKGYVSILKEGLAYAARLSVRGEGEQRDLVAAFVEYILRRAKEEGDDVHEKAKKIIEEGMSRGSLMLKGLEKKVEVGGREYVVKVKGGGAELEESRRGKKLLRIKITAEVDGVQRDYEIVFGRYGEINAVVGRAYASADDPDGGEADAERFSALIKALTGKEPRIRRRSDGRIIIDCYRWHLESLARYAELAKAIAKWLEETGR